MGKRFKLRLARVIPIFQSCRSKDPADLPSNPSPFFILSPNTTITTTRPKSHPSSLSRHVSSSILSIGCGCKSKSTVTCLSSSDTTESEEFQWKQEKNFHVVAKIAENPDTHRRKIDSASVSDESDSAQEDIKKKKKQRKKKKKKMNQRKVRFSTSSHDSDMFSTGEEEDDEECETLVSSSSTDLQTIRESPLKKKKKKNRTRRVKRFGKNVGEVETYPSTESESPTRLSVFQRIMPCKVEGKVKESFAIVKKSEDPFEDFKRSMVEMILEKQMFDVGDLEQLLHCFLSLNSRCHHGVIVEAFSEIWEVLFCNSSLKG